MARKTEEEPPPQTPGDDDDGAREHDRIMSIDALHDKLDRLAEKVERFFDAGGHAGKPDRGSEGDSPGRPAGPPAPLTAAATAEQRRAEIRDELASLKKQEAADEREKSLAEWQKKIDRAIEKPPRELRKVEQLMKWGD